LSVNLVTPPSVSCWAADFLTVPTTEKERQTPNKANFLKHLFLKKLGINIPFLRGIHTSMHPVLDPELDFFVIVIFVLFILTVRKAAQPAEDGWPSWSCEIIA
jgi:hypothetical protein